MRKLVLPLIILFVITFFNYNLFAQDAVGIGTRNPNPHASLTLGQDDKGLQLNRVDTTSLFGILGLLDHGLIVYDTVIGELFVWNGTNFVKTGGSNSPWNISGSDINYTSGFVGIGTSSPTSPLHVIANSTSNNFDESGIYLYNPNSGGTQDAFITTRTDQFGGRPIISLDINNEGGYSMAVDETNTTFEFFPTADASGSPMMTFDLGGNLGLNTNAPEADLDIVGKGIPSGILGIRGGSGASYDHMYFEHDNGTAFIRAGGADNGLSILVGDGSTGSYGDAAQNYSEGLRLLANGNVGIGTSNPLSRFQIGNTLSIYSPAPGVDIISSNLSDDGGGGAEYIQNAGGGLIFLGDEEVAFFTWPTGVAGNTAGAFSRKVSIQANGMVVGGDNPSEMLDVRGAVFLEDISLAPSTVTGRMYNVGGDLFWNGTNLTTGSSLWSLNGSDVFYTGGNVGIGTNTPGDLVEIVGGDIDIELNQAYKAGNEIVLQRQGSGVWVGSNLVTPTIFRAGNEVGRFLTTGELGIGTTNPQDLLHGNSASASTVAARFTNSTTGSTGSDGFAFGITGTGSAFINNDEASAINISTNSVTRMTINASGNIGIGNSFPSARLDVDAGGSIEVDGEYTYESPKTHYMSLAPAGFTSLLPDDYDFGPPSASAATQYYYFKNGGAAFGYAVNEVNLPDNATVTELKAWVYDNSTNPVRVSLRRQLLGSSSVSSIIEASTDDPGDGGSATSISVQELTETGSVTIDNSTNAYYLFFTGTQNTTDTRLYGVRITYTVDQAD